MMGADMFIASEHAATTSDPLHPVMWAGYRNHSRARSTGTLIVLVDGWEQGLSSKGGGEGRWFLICDEHGGLLSDTHQAVLRPWMAAPEQWCPGCQEAAEVPAVRSGSAPDDGSR